MAGGKRNVQNSLIGFNFGLIMGLLRRVALYFCLNGALMSFK